MRAPSHRSGNSWTAKLGVTLMAAASLLLVWMAIAPPATADPEANNWYICKYVGKPGVDERLQTGQNPIFTDENSIPISPVAIGSEFADEHGRSIVIAGPYAPNDRPDPEPDAGDCPPPNNPCPSGTSTVTATETETETFTTTVTAQPDAALGADGKLNVNDGGGDGALQEEECTTTTTKTVTTTTPTTVTTTVTPIVSGSTVTPPPTTTDEVAPTTVTPTGGTAFTGPESVVPLGTIALLLMSTGSGLLWAGSRRRRDEDDQD